MIINKNSKIKYTLENQYNEEIEITFTLKQIEGSVLNFYEQLKKNLKEDDEDLHILKREIMEE